MPASRPIRLGDARMILEMQIYLQGRTNERKINMLPVVRFPVDDAKSYLFHIAKIMHLMPIESIRQC
jgi:hypothetical protein